MAFRIAGAPYFGPKKSWQIQLRSQDESEKKSLNESAYEP